MRLRLSSTNYRTVWPSRPAPSRAWGASGSETSCPPTERWRRCSGRCGRNSGMGPGAGTRTGWSSGSTCSTTTGRTRTEENYMQRFGSVLVDHFPQDISIRVRGEGVLQFQGNAPSKELGPDVMPDPVEAFVEGVRFGMLGGSKQPPWGGRAEVLEKKVDLAKLEQH